MVNLGNLQPVVDSRALAQEIAAEHHAACQAARSAITHARQAGELLMRAKGRP